MSVFSFCLLLMHCCVVDLFLTHVIFGEITILSFNTAVL